MGIVHSLFSSMDPLRLWYTVGKLEPVDAGPQPNVSRGVRAILRYRAAMHEAKKKELSIPATIEYAGCLAWALKHNPTVLDGTSFLWLRNKSDPLTSNRGVALEYFLVLLCLSGLYVAKAKRLRNAQPGNPSIAEALELAAQACVYTAHHTQRHPDAITRSDVESTTAAELMERARLLKLCAQQEIIVLPRADGALHLMRELHGFVTSANFGPMRAFAQCMLADWRMGLSQRLVATYDPRTFNKDIQFEQLDRIHQFTQITASEFLRRHKKDKSLQSMTPPTFVKHVRAVRDATVAALAALHASRAQVSMVSGAPMGEPEPSATDLELFDDLVPDPIPITQTPLHVQLKLALDTFTTGPAQDMRVGRPGPEPPLQDLKTYMYAEIPPDKRKWVLWGALAERRHQLEEDQTLWPSAETQDELVNVIRVMGKIVLV
jgi:hypothetical protein